jgi:hypothetical protein
MQIASGVGTDSQWFDYRPTFFSDPVRVEWDKGTMFAALPPDTAGYLLNHGYARPMTEAEVEAYTAPAQEPDPPPQPKSRKREKETTDDSSNLQ